jgi:5-bromo-4-chloroindolyl phosphate hydrolysis protein
MKSKIIQLLAIAFSVILFFFPLNGVIAATQSKSNAASKAADKVIEEKQVKNQFGVSKKGEQMIDRARDEASQNLDELSDKAKSNEELPKTKKLFLKNLQGEE